MDGERSPGDADLLSRLAEGPAARETAFLSLLPTIDRIVSFVCRRNNLGPAEADDFRSLVRLKLIENDYDVLRRYQGRSTLRTYLTVVVQRRFLDYRISEWGKWRPSTEARRLGAVAIELERLTVRDNLSLGEAIETIRTRSGEAPSRKNLEALAARLPGRTPRRFVGEERAEAVSSGSDLENEVLGRELVKAGEKAASALKSAVDELPPQDRLILKMRFQDSFGVSEIAAFLRVEPKPLYRRFEGILSRLRSVLEETGLTGEEVS
ncbi:MAG: sigma-70 family RNA polymerase sigma factor, partial [Thermoanaerobaculia bacterium]